MFIDEVLPFVTNFVYDLNEALKEIVSKAGLSRIQKGWSGFCISGIIVFVGNVLSVLGGDIVHTPVYHGCFDRQRFFGRVCYVQA